MTPTRQVHSLRLSEMYPFIHLHEYELRTYHRMNPEPGAGASNSQLPPELLAAPG